MKATISDRQGETISRLRQMRESMGYSQDSFSAALGISISAYGKIENCDRALSMENIKKLHDRFGISADYLLFGENVSLEAAWFSVANCSEIDKMIVLSRLVQYFTGDEIGARLGQESLSEEFAKFVSDIMIKYDEKPE